MTSNEEAAERLRQFTSGWSAPEKLVVEDVIAGRATGAAPIIERRKAPGRPWRMQ
jgi:hypothetical protein